MKTHNGGGGGKVKKFGFAIFIIRDPRDATISNWNRRKGRKNALEKHIGSVGTERFCKSASLSNKATYSHQ